ncbi:MAG: long-chain fatty acid--CoA ligase [Anaerolineaceae bacterium]|nr:long-chain fatty acid--CoA ligase [Anaerolineaceae bacterium]
MTTYAERPWLKHYDPGVPHSLKPYPSRPLHSFLSESARNAPDRTALISPAKLPLVGFQSRVVTYGELDRLSDSFAAGLVDMGLKKGDRVAIVLPNSVAFAICYFGILKAGGVVAATNPTYPPKRMAYQINDCDAAFIVTLSLFYETVKQMQSATKAKTVIVTNIKEYLPPLARSLFSLTREKKEGHHVEKLHPGDVWFQDLLTKYDGHKPSVEVTSEDLGLFQYTGGTTGVSKGAMLTHGAMVANMLQIQAWSAALEQGERGIIREDMLYLGALPMFHVYGLVVLLSQAMASGSKIVLVANARDVNNMVDIIGHYRPNVFLGVPAMYNAVVNHERVKSGAVSLDCFTISSSGAAPLPPATKREFEELGARRLNEAYGMSETSAASHSNPLVGENRTGSVGLPFPDMDIRVVDLDDGETDMPVGEIGEIVMAGPNIMSGYHGMPTETANTLREKDGKRWLYSGDIGYMDEDGYFYIVDRKKDMALIGGFNVYPNNIEKALKEHPAVLEVGVAAIPHPEKEGEETLKAWIVLKPNAQVSEADLITHCSQYLAPYEIPRRYAFIDELPKTMVGKTLRRELIQLEMADAEKQP